LFLYFVKRGPEAHASADASRLALSLFFAMKVYQLKELIGRVVFNCRKEKY